MKVKFSILLAVFAVAAVAASPAFPASWESGQPSHVDVSWSN